MKAFPFNILRGTWFILAASACASAGANQPSKALLRAIPNVQRQLAADSWTNRVAVLDLLVVQKIADAKPLCELRYDLPPADYAFVLDAILDGMDEQFTNADAKALGASLPAWVHLLKTFRLDSIVNRISSLLERDNATLKGFSLIMLRALDDRTHDAAIARLLQSNDEPWRRLARETLIELRSKEVVPVLAEESQAEHELQRNAALANLEKIADPSAIPALQRSLSDPSEVNRIVALRALMATFEKQNTGTNLIPCARQVFHNSKEIETKWQALAWMANYGDPESVGPIMERLTGKNMPYPPVMDDTLRQVSLRVLIPAFIAALESDRIYGGDAVADMHVREYFVRQLGQMKVSQGIPVLSKLCSPKFPYLRRQAVQALGEIGSPESVPFLIDMLGEKVVPGMSPHDDVVVALFKIRDGRATAALRKHLTTPGLELGPLVSIFSSVFLDTAKTLQCPIDIETQGTPTEVISRASERTKTPIHVLPPEIGASNAPALPLMTMTKGHPLDSWLTIASTRLGEAYETRFHCVVGDKEVFVVANSRLPETFVQMFQKTITR